MSNQLVRAVLVAVLWLAGVGCGGCDHDGPGQPDAGDAGLDAAVVDARVDADARPDADAGLDARTDALVVQHHFCDQPFFKLPMVGANEHTVGYKINGGRVAWTRDVVSAEPRLSEIHVLDLGTCEERQLTQGNLAKWLDLFGDHLVWSDFKDVNGPTCSDLYHLDLSTGITTQLTATPGCEEEPATNGRYVAYRWIDTVDGPPTVPPDFRLLDLDTLDSTVLWPSAVDSFDMDEHHVVWAGYGTDPQSVGRDLYVHDLRTGQTRHLDFTYDRYQWWVFLWNGWITIRGTDGGLHDPLNWLQLYHLDTGELRELVVDDYGTASAPIGDGLAVWNTTMYSGAQWLYPADLELYDVASGFSRRLTTQDGNLAGVGISLPFLFVIHVLFQSDPFMNDFYIANLDALGVLDASGTLVPGGPVITPP